MGGVGGWSRVRGWKYREQIGVHFEQIFPVRFTIIIIIIIVIVTVDSRYFEVQKNSIRFAELRQNK